eukprot:1999236-Alexandrium_andersonii.AAC.1
MNLAAHAAIYPPALCAAILRGAADQHAGEGRPAPRHVADRMDRGLAVFDLADGASLRAGPGATIALDDADIGDVADFGGWPSAPQGS